MGGFSPQYMYDKIQLIKRIYTKVFKKKKGVCVGRVSGRPKCEYCLQYLVVCELNTFLLACFLILKIYQVAGINEAFLLQAFVGVSCQHSF
jgi:hypothetical protein